MTDENGRFHFDRLKTGRYTLSLHHVAYADIERLIMFVQTKTTPLVLKCLLLSFHLVM